MEKPEYYPRLDQAFGLLGMYLVFTFAVMIPLMIVFNLTGYENVSLMNFTGYTVAGGLLLWWAIQRKRKWEGEGRIFSFGRIPPVLYPVLVLATLALSVVVEPLVDLIPAPDLIKELFAMLGKADVFTFLVVAVSAPIIEEFLFRGIVLSGFLKIYSPWKAIILSSVFFGIFHLNPWQFIPAVFAGLLIGYVFWKTGSLLPCLFIHWINNFAGWLLGATSDTEAMSLKEILHNDTMYDIIIACSVLVLAASILMLRRIPGGGPAGKND